MQHITLVYSIFYNLYYLVYYSHLIFERYCFGKLWHLANVPQLCKMKNYYVRETQSFGVFVDRKLVDETQFNLSSTVKLHELHLPTILASNEQNIFVICGNITWNLFATFILFISPSTISTSMYLWKSSNFFGLSSFTSAISIYLLILSKFSSSRDLPVPVTSFSSTSTVFLNVLTCRHS